jgi:CheY-like chemotaxis protein
MSERPRCVLVVDDYLDSLESWSLFLRMSGFDVLTAGDGASAMQLVATKHPDVVVMDLDLPIVTGVEAARRLRAEPATHHLPLIATTGYSQGPQLDLARQAGFDLVLVKPCDPARLLAEIERLVAPPEAGDGAAHSEIP